MANDLVILLLGRDLVLGLNQLSLFAYMVVVVLFCLS